LLIFEPSPHCLSPPFHVELQVEMANLDSCV
jgi:hypothetical protein